MARNFEVTLLGVNSALPVYGRHPSCQIVTYDDSLFMIDCGEGSQTQLTRYKIKRSKIKAILISHLHGDHCFGLPGVLTSFSLQQRKSPLIIHGPPGIKKYLDTVFEVSGSYITYPLEINEYDTNIRNEFSIHPQVDVTTFPLDHRVPTMGFRMDEVNIPPRMDGDKIQKLKLSVEEIVALKSGTIIIKDGKEITPDSMYIVEESTRSYVYCSDTAYTEDIIPIIKNASLIYHETTYLSELESLAEERKHTTLEKAIQLAKKSNVSRFISGHYSSRYHSLEEFETRGKKILKNFHLGEEGKTFSI